MYFFFVECQINRQSGRAGGPGAGDGPASVVLPDDTTGPGSHGQTFSAWADIFRNAKQSKKTQGRFIGSRLGWGFASKRHIFFSVRKKKKETPRVLFGFVCRAERGVEKKVDGDLLFGGSMAQV